MTPPPMPTAAGRQAARLLRRLVLNRALPWEKQRARMATASASLKAPKGVEVSTDIVGGVPVEVLTPSHRNPTGTLIQIHGGGFTVGSPALSRPWAGAIAAALGIEVIVPDYRLAPEHPFPCGFDDVAAVIDDVLRRFDPASVALSGDSAGANLALGAAVARVAQGASLPAAMVLMSPWLDLAADRLDDPALVARDPMLSPEWLAACAVAYAPGQSVDPKVSPLRGELSGLPPVLIQGGTDDVLAPDAARLASILGAGATLSVAPDLWHAFSLQVSTLKAADRALAVTLGHLSGHLDLAAD